MKKVPYCMLMITAVFLLCGGLWVIAPTHIKAKTKTMVEIDSNTNYTYELLEPNQRIVEPNFIENTDFTDYVQGETMVHNWKKKHFYSNSLPVNAVEKNRLKNNVVNVNDGVVTLDSFSGESEKNGDLTVAQLNKMNLEGKNIKTIYLGENPSDDYLNASTDYVPMTQDIIQNEKEQTISILGVQDGVNKIDVFDYDLNLLYSTPIENDPKKLDQSYGEFQHATVTDEGDVYIYPDLQGISSESEGILPLVKLAQNDPKSTDQMVYLKLGEFTHLKATDQTTYNVAIDQIYFSKSRQMIIDFSVYDSTDKKVSNDYVLFDEQGNYIKELEVPEGELSESSQFGEEIYISSYHSASDQMTLYGFSFKDLQCTILKTYKHIQSLHIYEEEDEIIAYGQTSNLTTELTNMSSEPGAFIATLNDAYRFESAMLIPDNQAEISVKNIYKLPDESDYFINGILYQKDSDFQVIDEVNSSSDFSWSESAVLDERTNLFYGTITKIEDYAPMIKSGETLVINKDEVDFSTGDLDGNGHTVKDRLLLFGNEAGDASSESSVQVYDTYDTHRSFDPLVQDELLKKINRNPNNTELAIDWLALGFNEDTIGPQRTHYFVTDSQNQVSSTSKVVNLIDNQTIYDEHENIALHIEDFVISLQEATNLMTNTLTDPEKAQQYGNLLAWNLSDETENCAAMVEVDEKELDAINYTNQFGKFPLTYRFSRNGHAIQQTIFVYVLDENSEQIGDTVFYAKKGLIPWDVAKGSSLDELTNLVFESTQATAYNVRTGEELTEKLTLSQEDKLLLNTLELTSSPTDSITQSIQFMIDGQKMSNLSDIEVYYRFEHIYVSYVDREFKPLDSSTISHLDVPMSMIENQVVGDLFEALDSVKEIEMAIYELKDQGYQQKGIYSADKTTMLTKNDWMVTWQHGQGNQLYMVFE